MFAHSFFFDTEENGRVYRVGSFGGAGSNTLVRGKFDYEGCREDYVRSIQRLKSERVDVFIGNHVWNNATDEKGKHLLETGENLFIDGSLWGKFLEYREKRFYALLAQEAAEAAEPPSQN